jgi:group I intron endonuclease
MSDALPVKVYIYGLYDDTGIRYVGQGADPDKRLRDHMRSKKKNHKTNWIQKLKSEEKAPKVCILEETDEENFEERERFWIAFGRENGWKLTNATNGGIGTRGYKHSKEARQKMADAKIGNTWNIGRLAGKPKSEEQKRKIAATLTGRTLSDEHKRKISEAGKGRVQSTETRKKLSDFHRGKVVSAESRRRMSEARKGRAPWNKGQKCNPPSESTRKLLSEAMREYRRRKKEAVALMKR